MIHRIAIHQTHPPEITVVGDEADGICAMQDRVKFDPLLAGWGHYYERYERYERQDGQWQIPP